MKNFFKYLFIAFTFIITLWLNTPEAYSAEFINDINNNTKIEKKTTQQSFKKVVHTEKYLVASTVKDTSAIFSQKNNNDNSNYGNSREKLSTTSRQFSLLISYLYNKTYLKNNIVDYNNQLLATIKPNAP